MDDGSGMCTLLIERICSGGSFLSFSRDVLLVCDSYDHSHPTKNTHHRRNNNNGHNERSHHDVC